MSTAAKLILAQKLAFLNTINNALDTIDELHEAQAGTMREGGRLRLETLGDDAWTQHFRYVSPYGVLLIALRPKQIHSSRSYSSCGSHGAP